MHLTRTAAAIAIVGAVAIASDASAGAGTLTLTDVTGDANAVNNQDVEQLPFDGNVAGPAQRPEADLLSVTFAPLRSTKACGGFTATVRLAAAPGDNLAYRVMAQSRDMDVFWLEYHSGIQGAATEIRSAKTVDEQGKYTPIAPARLVGNSVVFTVTTKDLRAAGAKADRFALFAPGVGVRTASNVGVHVTAPAWDIIDRDESKSFAPCG